MAIKPYPIRAERGIPLLRAIWEDIKLDPSAWKQGDWLLVHSPNSELIDYLRRTRTLPWDCGTAACIAGHTVLSVGAQFTNLYFDSLKIWASTSPDAFPDGFTTCCVRMPGTDIIRLVDSLAAELLGITNEQARELFRGDNSAEDIERFIITLEADPSADLFLSSFDARL